MANEKYGRKKLEVIRAIYKSYGNLRKATKLAAQILSIKGIRIEADNQLCMLRGSFKPNYCVYLDTLCCGEEDCTVYQEFIRNGWVKCKVKEVEK